MSDVDGMPVIERTARCTRCGVPIPRRHDDWCAACADGAPVPDERALARQFYERTAWPVGTVVRHPDDPSVLGHIVKRGGRQWTTRDRLPLVRWYGKIDAEPVAWERLIRA